MSEVVWEDWKLKAQVVVKLRRENTKNMLVSLSLSQVLALRTNDVQRGHTPRPKPSPRGRCQSRGRPHADISE